MVWTFGLWMPERFDSGRLDFAQLDGRTLDTWTLDAWKLRLWTPGRLDSGRLQISEFFEIVFSKSHCRFRKGHNTQQCLLAMLEKWKRSVDSGKAFGALLTDLSKAFDCLDHELLIAKLNAYRFSLPALNMIHDYLSHRKQGLIIHIVACCNVWGTTRLSFGTTSTFF